MRCGFRFRLRRRLRLRLGRTIRLRRIDRVYGLVNRLCENRLVSERRCWLLYELLLVRRDRLCRSCLRLKRCFMLSGLYRLLRCRRRGFCRCFLRLLRFVRWFHILFQAVLLRRGSDWFRLRGRLFCLLYSIDLRNDDRRLRRLGSFACIALLSLRFRASLLCGRFFRFFRAGVFRRHFFDFLRCLLRLLRDADYRCVYGFGDRRCSLLCFLRFLRRILSIADRCGFCRWMLLLCGWSFRRFVLDYLNDLDDFFLRFLAIFRLFFVFLRSPRGFSALRLFLERLRWCYHIPLGKQWTAQFKPNDGL